MTTTVTESAPVDAVRPAVPWHRRVSTDTVALVAVGLVAVHVLDDTVLQPAGGTSAADHLLGALVPVTLLAAAAVAYGRVRAGSAAVIAFAVGLFGLVSGGVEPYHYGRSSVGLSGDDWSGIAAAAAGLVLLGLGGWRLWTSRHRDGGRLRRWSRRAGMAVGAAVVLQYVAFPVGFSYVVTHVARAGVAAPHLGAAYEDVTLTTSDGLHLEGWYVPSRNGAAVVAFPGRTNPQPHARMLVRHGYGVLLIDRRGEGASEGDGNMFGWGATPDIHAAVHFLESRPEVDPDRVAGIGFSVGGELMLQAAAEDPDGLDAVISEGAGTRTLQEQHRELSARVFWSNIVWLAVKEASVTVFSGDRPPASLTEVVPRIAPRPTLLIWAPHGGNMETMTPVYGRLIGSSAEVWSIPDAQHMRGLQAHPAEYERRVVGFLDRALPAGATATG